MPGWRVISLRDQWDRFVADVPAGERPVLDKRYFDEWDEAYLDIDASSRTRTARHHQPRRPPDAGYWMKV